MSKFFIIAALSVGLLFAGPPVCSPTVHLVLVTWTASQTANVTGYNVYRGTVTGGPYTKLNTTLLGDTRYIDKTVAAGATYYYVATSFDGTTESVYSSEITAVIPSP